MTSNKLFTAAYWLMQLAPIYAVAGIVLGAMGVPGPVVLTPMLLFVAAAAYIARRKCPHCGSTVYTADNMRKVGANKLQFPAFRFRHCVACGEAL